MDRQTFPLGEFRDPAHHQLDFLGDLNFSRSAGLEPDLHRSAGNERVTVAT